MGVHDYRKKLTWYFLILSLFDTGKPEATDGSCCHYCLIPVGQINSQYQPLITKPHRINELEYPIYSNPASLKIRRGNSIRVVCPYNNLIAYNETLANNVAFLECLNSTNFQLDSNPDKVFNFTDIRCENPTNISMKQWCQPCREENCLSVGIQLSPFDFIGLLTIEFSRNFTRASSFTFLHPTIESRQRGSHPWEFAKGVYYEQFKMDIKEMFTSDYQRRQFKEDWSQDGRLVDSYWPESGNDYLTEAQLISKDDLYYIGQQRATFFYENVVPLWKSVRDGNWNLVDRAARKISREISSSPTLVIAGVYDVLTLSGSGGTSRDVILKANNDESLAIVVPKFVYKIIFEPSSGKGMVFVTINNPRITEASKELVLCNPLEYCRMAYPQFSAPTLGFTYCCTIREFLDCCYGNKFHLINPRSSGC